MIMVIIATFDFGRKRHEGGGGQGAESNQTSRLHSFDDFLEDGNTSESAVSLTLWQRDDTARETAVVISANLSECG